MSLPERLLIADSDGVVHRVVGSQNIIGELHLRCRRFLTRDEQHYVSKLDDVTCVLCLAEDR